VIGLSVPVFVQSKHSGAADELLGIARALGEFGVLGMKGTRHLTRPTPATKILFLVLAIRDICWRCKRSRS
jgi:hypothetical protein